MKQQNNLTLSALRFHTTQPYPCSYFPERLARAQVATPDFLINSRIYNKLIQAGFRRSGAFTYRPCCEHCHACVPTRIRVQEFLPSRAQRRTWRRHQRLTSTTRELYFNPAHFSLYQRYQKKRHGSGSIETNSHTQYQDFLLQSNVNSRLIEFHEDGQLRMISIIDKLSDGFSSVYTFYDPDIPNASLGTFSILWQIKQCQELGLPYVYLGYWIKENQKMRYKSKFQPLEILVNAMWQPFDRMKNLIK